MSKTVGVSSKCAVFIERGRETESSSEDSIYIQQYSCPEMASISMISVTRLLPNPCDIA